MKIKIKEYRKKCGYTQSALAEKLGVTKQMVSKWERDAYTPNLSTLVKMKKIFNCSFDDLVSD